jgi:CubicO group peptidase (beta-lactamase class C family)
MTDKSLNLHESPKPFWLFCAAVFGAILLSLALPKPAAQTFSKNSEIDRFIAEQMKEQSIPGMALAVTRGNEIIHVKGYGRDGNGLEITPQTQFFIASVSKSLTALAVMLLVEAKRIDLDAPLKNYLPELSLADASAAELITVRYLLNQTSGLSDAGFSETRGAPAQSAAERLEDFKTARLTASPGTEFHYFNPNYEILARIVEKSSGMNFSDYLQSNIFAPLEMKRTFNVTTSPEAYAKAHDLAKGHLVAFGAPFPRRELNGYLAGSGGVVSTAEDLANYLIMQNNSGVFGAKTLISPASLELMHTAPARINGSYAMGWQTGSENEKRIIEHNGILSTFYADAVLIPDERFGIILLYDVHSLPQDILAFPKIKRGLIAILADRKPPTEGLSVKQFGIIFVILAVIIVSFQIAGFFRVKRWKQDFQNRRLLRQLFLAGWNLAPLILLPVLPYLILLGTGRYFGFSHLSVAMPDLMLLISACAAIGIVKGIIRLKLIFFI